MDADGVVAGGRGQAVPRSKWNGWKKKRTKIAASLRQKLATMHGPRALWYVVSRTNFNSQQRTHTHTAHTQGWRRRRPAAQPSVGGPVAVAAVAMRGCVDFRCRWGRLEKSVGLSVGYTTHTTHESCRLPPDSCCHARNLSPLPLQIPQLLGGDRDGRGGRAGQGHHAVRVWVVWVGVGGKAAGPTSRFRGRARSGLCAGGRPDDR